MAKCDNNFESLPNFVAILLAVTNILICVVAAFGNLLIFVVFYKDRRLHIRPSCSLLSLVMTDLLVGLLLEPMLILQLINESYRAECSLNTFRRFITAMLMGASMSSIALISYDRYILLSKSNKYKEYMSNRKLILLISLCWTLPGLSPLLNYTFAGHGFFSAVIFIYTFLMLFVMIWSYFTIMKIVDRNERQLNELINKDRCSIGGVAVKQNSFRRSRIKAARAISVVLLCFVVSNTPLTCYLAIVAGSTIANIDIISTQAMDILYVTTITSTLMNSVINPVIYYFRIPEFKNSLARLVNRRFSVRVSFESTNIVVASTLKRRNEELPAK